MPRPAPLSPLAGWLAPDTVASFMRGHGGRAILVPEPGPPWPEVPLSVLEEALVAGPAGTLEWITGGVTRTVSSGPLAKARNARASLRINRVHTLVPAIGELAHALRTELEEEIGANAYLSWDATSTGLAPHTDPYDVLVLQLSGRKRWTLEGYGEPGPCDLERREHRTTATRGVLETEAGQLMFLPRGLRHHALAQSTDAPSFHVTFAIRSKTRSSIVEWLASTLEEGNVEPWPPRCTGQAPYQETIEALRARCEALLGDPERAVEAFLSYREGLEYERTSAPLPEHRAGDARRDR